MKNMLLLLSVFTLFSFFSCEKEALVLPEQAQEEFKSETPPTELDSEIILIDKGEIQTQGTILTNGIENSESQTIEPPTPTTQSIPIFNTPITPEAPPRTTSIGDVFIPDTHSTGVIILGQGDETP